jgi:hypothetical protein
VRRSTKQFPRERACPIWVVLVDGDPHQIQLLHAEAARHGVTITIVCDLIHVPEYCWCGARCLHADDDPATEQCVAAWGWARRAGTSTRSSTT